MSHTNPSEESLSPEDRAKFANVQNSTDLYRRQMNSRRNKDNPPRSAVGTILEETGTEGQEVPTDNVDETSPRRNDEGNLQGTGRTRVVWDDVLETIVSLHNTTYIRNEDYTDDPFTPPDDNDAVDYEVFRPPVIHRTDNIGGTAYETMPLHVVIASESQEFEVSSGEDGGFERTGHNSVEQNTISASAIVSQGQDHLVNVSEATHGSPDVTVSSSPPPNPPLTDDSNRTSQDADEHPQAVLSTIDFQNALAELLPSPPGSPLVPIEEESAEDQDITDLNDPRFWLQDDEWCRPTDPFTREIITRGNETIERVNGVSVAYRYVSSEWANRQKPTDESEPKNKALNCYKSNDDWYKHPGIKADKPFRKYVSPPPTVPKSSSNEMTPVVAPSSDLTTLIPPKDISSNTGLGGEPSMDLVQLFAGNTLEAEVSKSRAVRFQDDSYDPALFENWLASLDVGQYGNHANSRPKRDDDESRDSLEGSLLCRNKGHNDIHGSSAMRSNVTLDSLDSQTFDEENARNERTKELARKITESYIKSLPATTEVHRTETVLSLAVSEIDQTGASTSGQYHYQEPYDEEEDVYNKKAPPQGPPPFFPEAEPVRDMDYYKARLPPQFHPFLIDATGANGMSSRKDCRSWLWKNEQGAAARKALGDLLTKDPPSDAL